MDGFWSSNYVNVQQKPLTPIPPNQVRESEDVRGLTKSHVEARRGKDREMCGNHLLILTEFFLRVNPECQKIFLAST